MFRYFLAIVALCAAATIGCCTGPGCGSCYDCGGVGGGIPAGPIQQLRAWRKSMICGAGCGGVYVDEWASYPPDCEEPCPATGICGGGCGTDSGIACGGCGTCGTCLGGVRPVRAVARLARALYGKRCCESCGFGLEDCCCGGEVIADSGGCSDCGGGGGCAGGNCAINRNNPQTENQTRMADMSQQLPAANTTVPRAPRVQRATRIPPSRLRSGMQR